MNEICSSSHIYHNFLIVVRKVQDKISEQHSQMDFFKHFKIGWGEIYTYLTETYQQQKHFESH